MLHVRHALKFISVLYSAKQQRAIDQFRVPLSLSFKASLRATEVFVMNISFHSYRTNYHNNKRT